MSLSRALASCLPLLMAPPPALAGDVHVVDAQGGGDHLTIQPAVDAASSGDVVLVKPGTYPAFSVVNKGLSVIADGGPVLVEGGIRVQATLEAQPVLLAGMELRGSKVAEQDFPALVLEDTRGAVRVEDCVLRGAQGNNTGCGPLSCPGTQARGGEALVIERALDAVFVRCDLLGGMGRDNLISSENGGGHAVTAVGSMVSFQDCVLRGGPGGTASPPHGNIADGGDGGHGIRAEDTPSLLMVVHLAGTGAFGGQGGDGGDCLDPSGDGGHGALLVRTAGGAGTRGLRLDSTLAGGAGGCFGAGAQGDPLVLEGGATMTTLQGVARQVAITSPVREQQPLTLSFAGVPGDQIFLLRGLRPGFTAQPVLGGVLYLQPGTFSDPVSLGTIPAAGTLQVVLDAPVLPPGIEGRTLFLQGLFRDQASATWLASPATPVLLDAMF